MVAFCIFYPSKKMVVKLLLTLIISSSCASLTFGKNNKVRIGDAIKVSFSCNDSVFIGDTLNIMVTFSNVSESKCRINLEANYYLFQIHSENLSYTINDIAVPFVQKDSIILHTLDDTFLYLHKPKRGRSENVILNPDESISKSFQIQSYNSFFYSSSCLVYLVYRDSGRKHNTKIYSEPLLINITDAIK